MNEEACAGLLEHSSANACLFLSGEAEASRHRSIEIEVVREVGPFIAPLLTGEKRFQDTIGIALASNALEDIPAVLTAIVDRPSSGPK